MKKFSLLVLSTIAALSFSFIGTNAFEGKVSYEIAVSGGGMPPEAMSMFSGSELSVYIKGSKSRSDVKIGPQNSTTISDMKTNSSVVLMDMMGNKYKIKSDPPKDEKQPEVKVKYPDGTKTIAGYVCKRADLTFKDETGTEITTTLWFTEEITNHMGNNSSNSQFKGIKGMPLEYEMNADQGMKMRMTATKVSKESVPDSKFDIPADYKETTMEDLQKEMMKMMGGGQE